MSKLRATIRNYFVGGILVLAPVGLTVWLFATLIRTTDRLLQIKDDKFFYFISSDYHPDALLGFHVPGLGATLAIAIILLVGIFTRNFVGRRFVRMGERIVEHIPVVRAIYTAIKQLLGTVLQDNSSNFRDVVLLEYPRKGLYTLGFISGNSANEVQRHVPDELVGIFVPTTPNPTSGFFLMAPRKDLIYLDMSTEDAFKMVISFGIVTPEMTALERQESS
jgi:uncharacterized membrane protein